MWSLIFRINAVFNHMTFSPANKGESQTRALLRGKL